MIWLPQPVGKLSLFLSLPVCLRSSLQERGGRGRSQIIRHRGSLVSINHSILYAIEGEESRRYCLHPDIYSILGKCVSLYTNCACHFLSYRIEGLLSFLLGQLALYGMRSPVPALKLHPCLIQFYLKQSLI